jgi:hypothetical protein
VRQGHSLDHDAPSRYRIEAMAHTAADVVRNLGGLLFDRRCLGWDTAVLLGDLPERPRPAAIATSVQLYRSDPRVCARVDSAIASGSTEVVMWGDADSIGPKPQMVAVTHRISQAAATFKTQALAAAAHVNPPIDIVLEEFLVTRAIWRPPHTPQRSTRNRYGTCTTLRL